MKRSGGNVVGYTESISLSIIVLINNITILIFLIYLIRLIFLIVVTILITLFVLIEAASPF